MSSIPHKHCSTCDETKPLDQFKKRKGAPDGRKGICKMCANAAERIRSTTKYANDAEYRERVKTAARIRMNAKYVHHPKPSVADRAEKPCPICRRVLPRDAYSKNRDKSDGLHDTCKECRNTTRRERRQADPQWRDHTQAQQSHRYHTRYKDATARRHADRYVADPAFREKEKTRARGAYHRNPRPYIQRARERQRNALLRGSFTQQEFDALCARYEYRCLRCLEQKPLTADHVVPLSKGGGNTIHDIQPLCDYCNKSKQDRTVDYRPEWE